MDAGGCASLFFIHLTIIICIVQMTSYSTSIRLEAAAQFQHQSTSFSQQVLINSELTIAGQSLSAGYGRMRSLNVTVRRSASLTGLPQTPAIIISEPMTCEERARKDLEQDRKDAENELQRYEDAGVLLDTAERTTDIICFWEVCDHSFSLLHV